MNQSFKSETRYRHDWSVTICIDPEGKGFYTQCTSPQGTVRCTDVCSNKGSAWQKGYHLVDLMFAYEESCRYNAIALPLTLALLYVSGGDQYYKSGNKKVFYGRSSWKGYNFNILNLLTANEFLEEQSNPKQSKSVGLTLKGIKEARRILKELNLDGIDKFLENLAEHDDLLQNLENEESE